MRSVAGVFIFMALICVIAMAQEDEKPIYVVREPHAWGAMRKYCIRCHGVGVIDKMSLSSIEWTVRMEKCRLYMHSRGYPCPDNKDIKAMTDFFVQITPITRKPPVYLINPPRGGLAAP